MLAAEISRRLASYPVGAEAVYALGGLGDCYMRNIDVCLPLLEELEGWYDVAMDNPGMNPEDRALLLMQRAELDVHHGDYASAVERMRAAVRLQPENLSLPLGLARLHMELGQWDRVAEILHALEADRPWSGFGSRHVRWLRQHYENHLKTKGEGTR